MPTSSSSSRLSKLAEDAHAYLAARPGQERLETDRFVLRHGDSAHAFGGNVLRLRLGSDDFGEGVRTIKAWFRERGRTAFFWAIGPSTTPTDAADRLSAQGAKPLAEFQSATGMVLTTEPPAVPGVEVRKLETLVEHEAEVDIATVSFGWGDEHGDAMKRSVREHWSEYDPAKRETFGVFEDGRLIASAIASYSDRGVYLDGGATLPEARGRGAYTALVRARWDEAVRRGTPALAVQAGDESRPILERLGFVPVCDIRFLEDSAT